MKKIIAVIIALILVFAFIGCSKDDTTSAEQESETVETYDDAEEETESPEASDSDGESSDEGLISPEFKETMDNYEAWFDHYCDVMERYKEDSTNLELLSEMTDLLSEEATMLDEMENMDQDDMNTAELAYYLEVTARIEKKLLEATY